jgi:hypothetical protein
MGETDEAYELYSIDLDNFQGEKEKNSNNQIFQC